MLLITNLPLFLKKLVCLHLNVSLDHFYPRPTHHSLVKSVCVVEHMSYRTHVRVPISNELADLRIFVITLFLKIDN